MTNPDELRSARRLRVAVEELPRELRPERDLWPEIAGRLARGERPTEASAPAAGSWWRLAAAVLVMAGGLAAAVALGPGARPAGLAVAGPGEQPAPRLAAAELRQRDGVLQAHDDLMAAAARRRAGLDAAGVAALTTGLADLERAAAEIEAALAANPGNRRLRLALAAAYRRESAWAARWAHA
jgi:hypothetical protein